MLIRWDNARQKYGQDFVVLPPQNFEHHIIARLQLGHHAPVFFHRIHRFTVDLRDHVPAPESGVIREARRLDIRYEDALLPFQADLARAFRSQFIHAQPKFRRRYFAGLIAGPADLVREDPRTILDRRGSFLLLAVTHVGQLDLAPDRRRRNRVHQVVSALQRLAVHAGNYIAALQPGLLRRAARLDALDHDAVGSAERLQRDGIRAQVFLEAHADGTARHAPFRHDLVIYVDRSRRGQRKPDSFVSAAACNDRRVNSRSEEHTSELQSQSNLVCRLLLEKKKKKTINHYYYRNKKNNNKTEY